MLLDVHHRHQNAFRESNWLVRLNLVYLAVVPAFVAGALAYLAWFYLNL